MAKTNMANRRKTKQRTRKRVPNPRAADLAMLDAHAMAYVDMLSNPCHAPLAHPVFPGSDSGYLIRNSSMATIGNASGLKAGILNWVPGAINADDTELVVNATIEGGTGTACVVSRNSPGKNFLEQNTIGARCVAACLRVTYTGSEASRAGKIMYGPTTGAYAFPGQIITPGIFGTTLANSSRTPVDTVELIWVPGEADFAFSNPTASSDVQRLDSSAGLGVSWVDQPDGVGINFHFTAVYEWKPRQNLATMNPGIALRAKSRNTYDDVINWIQKHKVPLVKGAMYSGGAIANAFGLMPSSATQLALSM